MKNLPKTILAALAIGLLSCGLPIQQAQAQDTSMEGGADSEGFSINHSGLHGRNASRRARDLTSSSHLNSGKHHLRSNSNLSQLAPAAPIQGSIDFGGVVTFDTMSLATATKVNTWNSSFVLQDTGNFATFAAPGANATMAAPYTFDSGTPATPSPGPTTLALWQVGGFTFDLTTSTVVSQSANFLNISGVGTASGNGFSATPGTWSFTSSNSSGSNNTTFGFQAQTQVPEGNTIVLFGIGALGLLGRQLWRKKTA
jgi:hypothetical protein